MNEDIKSYQGVIIVLSLALFILIIVFFAFLYGGGSNSYSNLEEQLKSCEEKIEVWTAKFYCGDKTSRITMEFDFENKTVRDMFQNIILETNDMDCKIIK